MWEDLSIETREKMEEMGSFSPTVRVSDKMIKGYIGEDQEGQCYMGPEELREQAAAMIEVADWLEKRAMIAAQGGCNE
jgi:hypothetical protein